MFFTEFEKDSDWIKTFYADYTFEVDFVRSGNNCEVIQLINQIYTDKTTQDISEEELKDIDVAIYGKRVLTMANNEGKGWFAIMLSQYITFKTMVPEYIIDAVIFAKEFYSNTIIADIVDYRLNKNFKGDNKLDITSCEEILSKYRKKEASIDELISNIALIIPEDQILMFLEKVK